ncbi:hypothetical protein DSO57_1014802 [Entomophthora muscae]|uniref:Uncharacterized protein n=1 Tax=Entomophthora muscae TaxID=34485 RepID=A0ACC2URA0_9FUNG|nr:hypothetical protein DSO57_1014802 [Entomophthora muscae]
MKKIPTTPPLPNAPPTQDFSKLGFVYTTVLGLANQVVLHTGSWRPLATALNYLVCIELIVYMAFQAWPASPMGVQLDSGMGCDTISPLIIDLYQMIKGFHNTRTFIVFLQLIWEHLGLTRLGVTNIIVLVNVGLHKVADILDEFPMIETGVKIGQQQLATAHMISSHLFLIPEPK